MKINDTVLNARKALGLTQEQVAERLGVTASAVYKWEKGSAYPDITILAPLARLLKMDLNTLLSFQKELTSKEIGAIVQDIIGVIEKDGYEAGFRQGMEKIREYSSCDLFVLNMAASLEGAQMMYCVQDTEKYEEQILKLYQGLEDSGDEGVRKQVNQTLFYHYLNSGRYDEAEEVFTRTRTDSAFYLQMKTDLYMTQGRNEEAKRAIQQKLLEAAGDVQNALMKLHSIAMKEGDTEMAGYTARTTQKMVETLELWEYGAYTLYLEIYGRKKDVAASIKVLRKLFDCAAQPWEVNKSPLYSYIVPSTPAQDNMFQKQVRPMMLEQLKRDENMAFLRESEEGKAFIQEMEERLNRNPG